MATRQAGYLDVAAVVESLRAQVKAGRDASANDGDPLHDWSNRLAAGRRESDYLHKIRSAVERLPPNPGTVRARISAHLVRIVQRMLFWYTPRIVEFHKTTARAIGHLCDLHEQGYRLLQSQEREIRRLKEEVRNLGAELLEREGLSDVPAQTTAEALRNVPVEENAELRAFFFALQDQFRGSEEGVHGKLSVYIKQIAETAPDLPPGPWVDLGCGRGEWLALAAADGREVIGVDANSRAVRHCRQLGLKVEAAPALDYLRGRETDSLAVVTAFHFLEHCPFEMAFHLTKEIARVLKRGGLLALEVPNPANLIVGAHDFWRDPTHQRPLPAPLLEFLLGFHGLKVIRRLSLNAPSEEEQLPFRELEFIARLNSHLYGSRDYGLIARR